MHGLFVLGNCNLFCRLWGQW